MAPFVYPNMVTPQTLASLFCVFVTFLCGFDTIVVSGQFSNFIKYELPPGVNGSESAAFRGQLVFTQGPFTAVTDGRILKWQDSSTRFVDFAYTSPTRTKQRCDGTTDPDMGPICGKPLALSFQPATGLLYIADAYFGLLVVGFNGGLATQLAGGFKFASGVDVDLITGFIYFQDASLTYTIRDTSKPGFVPDSTGRLLRYNPLTRQVYVLLSGLFGGGGPAVSRDSTFVLVPELNGNRILKYWLAGPKVNTAEVLLKVGGNPNKIKRAGRFGEFWVAVSNGYMPRAPLVIPQGVRITSNGRVLQTVSFATQFANKSISLVQEQEGKLYVVSRFANFVGVYSN